MASYLAFIFVRCKVRIFEESIAQEWRFGFSDAKRYAKIHRKWNKRMKRNFRI